MDSLGRRRFLMVLAGALGAGGVWWVRRDGDTPLASAADPAPAGRSVGSLESKEVGDSTTTTTSSSSTATTTPAGTTTSSDATTTSTTAPSTTTTSAATTTTTAPGSNAASVAGGRLEIIPRSAWGAAAAGTFTDHRLDRITVHHSAVGFLDNRLGPARLRQHQNYHQSLGWPDVAYHLVIDRNGNVFEGRPFAAVGDTGTSYDPTGHFLPMCEGNFDEHDPSAAQLDALAAVIGWARTSFATEIIAGHRDVASTTCPGDRLAARLADVVAASDGYLGLTLVVLSAEEGSARVAAIEGRSG